MLEYRNFSKKFVRFTTHSRIDLAWKCECECSQQYLLYQDYCYNYNFLIRHLNKLKWASMKEEQSEHENTS